MNGPVYTLPRVWHRPCPVNETATTRASQLQQMEEVLRAGCWVTDGMIALAAASEACFLLLAHWPLERQAIVLPQLEDSAEQTQRGKMAKRMSTLPLIQRHRVLGTYKFNVSKILTLF